MPPPPPSPYAHQHTDDPLQWEWDAVQWDVYRARVAKWKAIHENGLLTANVVAARWALTRLVDQALEETELAATRQAFVNSVFADIRKGREEEERRRNEEEPAAFVGPPTCPTPPPPKVRLEVCLVPWLYFPCLV